MNDRDYRYNEEAPEIETRAISDGVEQSFIKGYGIVFNKWSSPMRAENGRMFIEKINPDATKNVDWAKTVSAVNHDISGRTLGKHYKGTLSVRVDSKGVHYTTTVPDTNVGRDALTDVKNGNLEGSSFLFNDNKTNIQDSWDLSKDPAERTILNINRVIEIGPVTIPAYPDSTAVTRSLDEAIEEAKPKVDYEALKLKAAQAKKDF